MQSPFPIITTFLDQTSVVNLVSKFPSKTSSLSWETYESCIIMDCIEMHHCTALYYYTALHRTTALHILHKVEKMRWWKANGSS